MLAISIGPEVIATIAGFPITNTMLVAGVLFFVILAIIGITLRSIDPDKPATGIAGLMEVFVEFFLDFVESITNDRDKALKFFPIAGTIFFVVLLSNLVELWPGMGTIGVWGMHHGELTLIPFIRSVSADLNFTFVVALFAMISVQIMGMHYLGFTGYWSKFFVAPWHKPFIIGSFVGILELISEFSKVLSFSFRLFGNIFAGEVLLLVIGFLAPFLAPLPFLFLELFVGFVQALVFATLTIVFLNMATIGHGEHEDEQESRADYSKATFGGKLGGVVTTSINK